MQMKIRNYKQKAAIPNNKHMGEIMMKNNLS